MRNIVKCGIAALAMLVAGTSVMAADEFPNKLVRIIVPSAAGGGLDILTRLVAQKMGEKLGQTVIVDNRPGADTLLGTRAVKEAPADGYTLLAQGDGITLFPHIKLNPGYDIKDFTGVGIMARLPFLMVVAGDSTDRGVADYVAPAKANKLDYASGGVGTPPHVSSELFLKAAGLTVNHIPYKGNAVALPDVATGRISMIHDTFSSSISYIKSGRLKALAITSPTRIAPLPHVPTFKEQGVNFSYTFWLGLLVRSGTPKDVVQRLSESLQYALNSKDLNERIRSEGSDPTFVSPQEFSDAISLQSSQMGKLAADLQIPKQ